MRTIATDDFVIVTSAASNILLKWKHNNRTIRIFKHSSRYGEPKKRAIKFRDWLIRYYAFEHWQLDDNGHIEKSQAG